MNVPGIRMVDAAEGILVLEWIEGQSVRYLLGGGAEGEEEMDEAEDEAQDLELGGIEEDSLSEYGVAPGTPFSSQPVLPG